MLDAGSWFEFLKDLFYAWCEYNDPKIRIREINEIIAWRLNKPLNLCSSGKACTHWFSVSPFGDVSACEYYNYSKNFGNIMKNSFSDIFQGKVYKDFEADQLFINPKCKNCKFFALCGNGCSRLRRIGNSFNSRGVYIYCEQRKKLYNEVNDTFNSILSKRRG
ncbi:hypothetical protein A2982_02165 [candidate division WWE3 bacterium RIFCSPLOWO2_01_FULL_39_13]|uniref:4Fe4S-binding SPASM domain-containing protein n=1 Tax=candidate division WWE3 bacterium RIFCSPLOWO2_01_FULL_39_13 TaxID=1802624 RepID=A0A1F4V3U5_UNCKA|nr:MAG: hypothetical protein A2982_02165 [candidate division WWE3 bacterium RIFCSPLOWO2_01_FULL_39_13]